MTDDVRYVLVPVPREHVLDVMRWVLFRAPGEETDSTGRDVVRVRSVVEEASAAERIMLLEVARATAKQDTVRLDDVALELGQTAQDLAAMIRAMNHRALGGGRNLIQIKSESAVGVSGQHGRITCLEMREDFATIVRQTAKQIDRQAGNAS